MFIFMFTNHFVTQFTHSSGPGLSIELLPFQVAFVVANQCTILMYAFSMHLRYPFSFPSLSFTCALFIVVFIQVQRTIHSYASFILQYDSYHRNLRLVFYIFSRNLKWISLVLFLFVRSDSESNNPLNITLNKAIPYLSLTTRQRRVDQTSNSDVDHFDRSCPSRIEIEIRNAKENKKRWISG